jgi:hypothetical protein
MAVSVLLTLTLPSKAANVALGKPAYATYNQATQANVNDNSLTTTWDNNGSFSAPNDSVWIDLGAPTPIKSVRMYWNGEPLDFNVDVATTVDNDINSTGYGTGDWTTVYTRSSIDPRPGSPDLIDLSSQNLTYRYVRINGMSGASAGSLVWGITEFQIFNTVLPTVSGTVKYAGSPVPNAVVTLVGPAGPLSSTATTTSNASGVYSFVGVLDGSYTLSAYAPGKYALVTMPLTVGTSNITQDIVFTATATNSTAILPGFSRDMVTPIGTTNADASTTTAFPAEEWPGPAAGGIWDTSTTPPTGLTLGASLPKTLKFALGPIETGKNNALNIQNAVIPFAPAHYSTIYILQTAMDGAVTTSAVLNYADGTSTEVLTPSGSPDWYVSRGDAAPPVTPSEAEIIAFQTDGTIDVTVGGALNANPFLVFARAVPVDSTKVLKNITFSGQTVGQNTLSKAYILGWSADSVDTPAAYGSVSGTLKGSNGSPLSGAIAQFMAYRQVTDATGTYKFNSLPAGTWTVTASKPASYAPVSKDITLTDGQNGVLDFQFTTGITVVATGLGSPSVDLVSSDANYADFFATGWMPGREYYPTGMYSPDANGNDPNGKYEVAPGAPGGLKFNFVDYGDSPVPPGQPGYPVGGTPNVQLGTGGTFLAPPAKISAAYFAVVGAEGATNVAATLTYTDGTKVTKVKSVSDWFGSPTTDEMPYIIMRGRHSTTGESNAGASIRLNVLPFEVDTTKTLKQIDFFRASNYRVYPLIFAVAWETDPGTPVPDPVDVTVHTTPGAIVTLGPYSIRADASGNALFRGLPVGLSLGLGAYVPGQTKQVRNETFVVPSTNSTVELPIPASAPVFVPLPLYYDYDCIAMPDMPGDFKHGADNDRGFAGEEMGASGSTVTVAGVPYVLPHYETFYNNTQRPDGQVWKVIPGHYSSLNMVLTGIGPGGDHTEPDVVYLNYADGSREMVTYGVVDWVQNWSNTDASNLRLMWRSVNPGASSPFHAANRRNQNDDQLLEISFVPQIIPINAGKVLTSIEFTPMAGQMSQHDGEILCATLEANEPISGGTITGRVIGQPLGAAAPGPLGGVGRPVQVILDDAHAAYTAADGTFTIPNAPLGAGTLKVIAYGTGILTKTFPVTVTANTNVGDLNIGAGVTQVSVILGPANVSKGLEQVDAKPTPYGVNLSFARTSAGTVGGKSARTSITDSGRNDIYFRVDPGWLFRGLIGNQGLDITTLGTASQKIAPHVYMLVEYYDNGTNSITSNYNKMETAVHTGFNVTSIRLTNQRAAGPSFTKTGTNSWKTTVLDFDPASNAFGAYKGVHLKTDFRLVASPTATGFQPTSIHSVVLSLNSNPVPPVTAQDILTVVGGLKAAPDKTTDAAAFAAYDVNGDGKVTVADAVAAAKAG